MPKTSFQLTNTRGGSGAAATSKMKRFVIIVNGHLGCCSSPRSASEYLTVLEQDYMIKPF